MIVAIDTETELIAPGVLAPRLGCLQYQIEGQAPIIVPHGEAVALVEKLIDHGATLVGHNIPFDLAVLVRAGLPVARVFRLYDAGRVRCTQIREQLDAIACGDLSTRDCHLAAIHARRCPDLPLLDKGADGWRLRYGELRDIPPPLWPERARAYALEDPAATLRVFRAQGGGRDLPDELPQTRAAWALHLMGVWGVRTDAAQIERMDSEIGARLEDARAAATAAGYIRPNGTKNTTALRAAVEASCRRDALPIPRTDRGSVSTDAETLEATGDPALAAVAVLTHLEKMRTTYLDAFRAGIDRALCPGWRALVASGRTSCREPNLQNPPREDGFRECFVPRAGHVFVSVDYDFLELRTLAQACLDLVGGSELAKAIRAGEDPHLSMAAEILGVPYSEALARKKEPAIKDARQLAKAANFGLPGGMGPDNFRAFAWATYRVRLSARQAADLIAAYHRRWPEIRRLFALVKSWTRSGAATITLPRIGRVRGGCGFCDGTNQLFQGPAASGAKESLYRVSRACYTDRASPLFGSRPVLFLHDEIIIEAPEDRTHEAGAELARIMRTTMVEVVTPDVPSGAQPAAMRRWSKRAEPTFDAAGRLIPWEPTTTSTP